MITPKEVDEIQKLLKESNLFMEDRQTPVSTDMYIAKDKGRGVLYLIKGKELASRYNTKWKEDTYRDFETFDDGNVVLQVKVPIKQYKLMADSTTYTRVRTLGNGHTLVKTGAIGALDVYEISNKPEQTTLNNEREVTTRTKLRDENLRKLCSKTVLEHWLTLTGVELDDHVKQMLIQRLMETVETTLEVYGI